MGEKGRRTAEEYIKIKKEEKRKFDKEHTSESNFAFHKHHYFKMSQDKWDSIFKNK